MDRRKSIQAAERLLKQGKLQAALTELQKISESAPNDLLTLNRLGDLLARQGRNAEAIGYYRKIANQFSQGGFLPKAAAIFKKILRLDPNDCDAMIELGQVYLRQNLVGEARSYMLHAANQFLQAQDFTKAREVYERLVEAQPDDVRHRLRLAETRAAEGDTPGAFAELCTVGRAMLDAGSPAEAEKIFRRAREFDEHSPAAVAGLASCLDVQGRTDESLALLNEVARASDAPELAGEIALRHEAAGQAAEVFRTIESTSALEIPAAIWQQLFRRFKNRDEVDQLWACADRVFAAQPEDDALPQADLLEQIAEIEPDGHVPALQRLVEVQERRGDTAGTIRGLEWLVRAYEARSMHDEASVTRDKLRELDADSSVLGSAAVKATEPRFSVPVSAPVSVEVPGDAEAPAVPLNRADEEFVASRLTQAEVLEKYGLRPQALEQIEEVTNKFPGHVSAQEVRVSMLRARNDDAEMAPALVLLAVALRASGDAAGARQAAAEALSIGTIDETGRARLAELGLVEQVRPAAAAAAPAGSSSRDAADLVIDFDDSDGDDAAAILEADPVVEPVAPAAAETGGSPTRVPGSDMLGEIRKFLESGSVEDARRRMDALTLLGYSSDEMSALGAEILEASAPAPIPQEPVETPVDVFELGAELAAELETEAEPEVADVSEPEPAAEPEHEVAAEIAAEVEPADDAAAAVEADAPPVVADVDPAGDADTSWDDDSFDLEDDDLSAITAALESELFDEEAKPLIPEEDSEQSIDDIFASFRAAVTAEVASDDHRTHYDLGIAYKEMGLVDEAIQEFESAVGSAELHTEACSMIAMCHRDREDLASAAKWYREALAATADGEHDALNGLRYDLAVVLLQGGDREGALDELRSVVELDPGFRDAAGRVRELESALRT